MSCDNTDEHSTHELTHFYLFSDSSKMSCHDHTMTSLVVHCLRAIPSARLSFISVVTEGMAVSRRWWRSISSRKLFDDTLSRNTISTTRKKGGDDRKRSLFFQYRSGPQQRRNDDDCVRLRVTIGLIGGGDVGVLFRRASGWLSLKVTTRSRDFQQS
jgi:hypothetical protein